jgi:hypothetical protein
MAYTRGSRSRALLLLTLFAGCSANEQCTLIGCDDTLTVDVYGIPSQTQVTVEAITAGQATRTMTCTSTNESCMVRFDEFSPSEVTMRVSWTGHTTDIAVVPSYSPVYPNGRDCGPACRKTRIAITV